MARTPKPGAAAADTAAISPQPPRNKGLDYIYLREKGIRLVQALSSAIWTDYNEHDPGVTTLEQLCYALTELSYRAELPLPDLLADREGRIQPRRHGMFIARRILPCNPVTEGDYRKLISDRVPAVRNVWVTPRIPAEGAGEGPAESAGESPGEVGGLYDILLYAPEADECARDCGFRPHDIVERVRHVYARYRNLCEDLHSVRILAPLRTAVHADVTCGRSQSPETVLANVLFAVGKLLAPEPMREPLNALLKAGETPGEIFNGPLLLRGFIPDEELQPKAAAVAVNDIVRAIASAAGVETVRNVTVRTGSGSDGEVYRANDSIPVPPERYPHLDTRARGESGHFTIRLFRNGALCHPDAGAVERELSRLWSGYRRSYPLEAQYEEYFGVPTGQWRDLAHYYSIQNQYPGVYGIGSFGLPPDASTARRAQAKQLKAYLLPFEQLMTDYFAQLAHLGDLFSIAPDDWRTYYWQSLAKSVPDVGPVLSPDYRAGMERIVSGGDPVVERRNRFAGFLLSLYANELYAERSNGAPDSHARENLLRARLAFLRLLVSSTRSRGRAFDYLAEPSARNFAGMEMKCRIEMGLDLEEHQPLSEALGKSRFTIARSAPEASIGQSEGRESRYMEEHFRAVPGYPEPAGVPEISAVLKGGSATEEFIECARDLNNLFVGRLPGEETAVLVCRTSEGGWILIDVHTSDESAIAEAYALYRHVKAIHHARTQLYIVEHVLLRAGRRPRRKRDDFEYSFTLTAVVTLPREKRMNRDDRTAVEEIVRENTPADTVAQVCFLDPWSMMRFESLNRSWRTALRHGRRFAISLASARLRRFLERHRHTTFTPPVRCRN